MVHTALGAPKLHHVGVIVADLDAAIERYRRLGFGEPDVSDVAEQGVRVASYRAGDGYVELMTPTNDESGVARFLASRGEGMHHVAYSVPDLDAALRALEEAGFELIDRTPRRGVHNWRIAFVHPRSCHGVLTELVEESEA